jgi:hypothetical protein
MPEYDFYATVQSDLSQLQKEIGAEGVSERIDALARRFGVARELALAALWRSSRRHGETLEVFVHELADQDQRETARARDARDGEIQGTQGTQGTQADGAAAARNSPQVGDTAPRL